MKDVRAWRWVIVFVGACLVLGSPPAAEPSVLAVSVRDGLLGVEAKEVSWTKVLDAVQHQTGIRLRVSIPLQGTVTVSCQELTIEPALHCLFGPQANFLLFYRAGDARSGSAALPSAVWVLGKGPEKVSTTTVPEESELAIPSALDDPTAAEVKRAFERNPQVAREAALHADDVEMRLLAIAYLGRQGKRVDLNVLARIVGDGDPHIRQSAVEALGPLVREDPQVRQALAHVLETAEDPEIQQLATDALGIPLDPPADAATSAATSAGAD